MRKQIITAFTNTIEIIQGNHGAQTPKIGESVHYVDPENGKHFSGTIVDINKDNGLVDIIYFGDPSGEAQTLQLLSVNQVLFEIDLDPLTGTVACTPGTCHRIDYSTATLVQAVEPESGVSPLTHEEEVAVTTPPNTEVNPELNAGGEIDIPVTDGGEVQDAGNPDASGVKAATPAVAETGPDEIVTKVEGDAPAEDTKPAKAGKGK